MSDNFVYTGQENLEAMKAAVRYNKYLIEIIKKQVSKDKNETKILDFGAGLGTYADFLVSEGFNVDCLELDEDQINKLKQKGYKVFKGISEVKNKFDIIYALNVFEHIENDYEVFNTLTSRLAVGGKIIVYVPAFNSIYSSMDSAVGHHRRYDLKRLSEMGSSSGLRVNVLSYRDPLGYFAALVYKFIGNKKGTITKGSVRAYDTFVFPVSKLIEPLTKKIIGKNAVLIAEKYE